MLRKIVATFAVSVIIMSACAALPADAAKRAKHHRAQPAAPSASRSLDGRVLGHVRTCGFGTLQYDGFGVPYGPYCH